MLKQAVVMAWFLALVTVGYSAENINVQDVNGTMVFINNGTPITAQDLVNLIALEVYGQNEDEPLGIGNGVFLIGDILAEDRVNRPGVFEAAQENMVNTVLDNLADVRIMSVNRIGQTTQFVANVVFLHIERGIRMHFQVHQTGQVTVITIEESLPLRGYN
jgi:hypothetical protein